MDNDNRQHITVRREFKAAIGGAARCVGDHMHLTVAGAHLPELHCPAALSGQNFAVCTLGTSVHGAKPLPPHHQPCPLVTSHTCIGQPGPAVASRPPSEKHAQFTLLPRAASFTQQR
jgi:hypothetical protein